MVWHLGELHAYERWLAIALAFGPFLLLALVIVVRRRQDADAAPNDSAEDAPNSHGVGSRSS